VEIAVEEESLALVILGGEELYKVLVLFRSEGSFYFYL
jgi:hypothetical protein